jgi:hypothetical protein
MKTFAKRVVVLLMVFQLLGASVPQMVHAALVSTQQVLDSQENNERLERIDRVLVRDEVRKQFVALGVDPNEVRQRVAALTDAELVRLEAGVGDMPAGGDSVLAVLGIILVVLLVLELVGVTNVFTKI